MTKTSAIGLKKTATWEVTFTHGRHELEQGAGNIGLLQLGSSAITADGADVAVAVSIVGTEPREIIIPNLATGAECQRARDCLQFAGPRCHVGCGKGHAVCGAWRTHRCCAVHRVGHALNVAWNVPAATGGGAIKQYKVQWYTALAQPRCSRLRRRRIRALPRSRRCVLRPRATTWVASSVEVQGETFRHCTQRAVCQGRTRAPVHDWYGICDARTLARAGNGHEGRRSRRGRAV